MQMYYVFMDYIEYYFHYVCVCINGIVQYASSYSWSFSLNIFLRSINTDVYKS